MSDLELQINETLEKLGVPNLSWDSVVLLSVRLLELRNPGKTFVLTDEPSIDIVKTDGSRTKLFLHNLQTECDRYPEDRVEIVERYFRILMAEDDFADVVADDIVALVRDAEYCAYVTAQEVDAVTEHLVGDLWVIYAVDRPQSTSVLTADVITGLGLSHFDVRTLGLKNLRRLLSDLEIVRQAEFYELNCENSVYLAGALLLDGIWEEAAAKVEGDVVVAVPSRDVLLFSGTSNPAGLTQLRQATDSVFSGGDHLISRTLMRRVTGQWRLFS